MTLAVDGRAISVMPVDRAMTRRRAWEFLCF